MSCSLPICLSFPLRSVSSSPVGCPAATLSNLVATIRESVEVFFAYHSHTFDSPCAPSSPPAPLTDRYEVRPKTYSERLIVKALVVTIIRHVYSASALSAFLQ